MPSLKVIFFVHFFFLESLNKNVLQCHLYYHMSLLNYVPYVPTWLRASRAYAPYVPTCLRALILHVPTCLHFSRAYVLKCLYIFFMPTCLRAYARSFFTCLCAYNHSQNILRLTSISYIAVFLWINWPLIPFKIPKQTPAPETAYPKPILWGFVISTGVCTKNNSLRTHWGVI